MLGADEPTVESSPKELRRSWSLTPSHAWQTEAFRLLRLTGPLATASVLAFACSLITTAFVGQLGAQQLSAWVLAHTFINITGLSLVIGTVSALETFCGQAAGAAQHATLGLSLQRGAATSTLVALPCILLWTQASRVLQFLGQPEEISILAGRYARWWAPTLLLYGPLEACQRFLVAQSVVAPSVIVSGASAALTALFNWLFIRQFGWGLKGAAAAYFCEALASLAMYVAFIVQLERQRSSEERTWQGWSWEAFSGWRTYFSVALPATAMMCLDWWSYEIVILLAGLLPDPEVSLGSMGIAFNTHAWVFMVANGMAAAASTRVSNALGAKQPASAQLSTTVSTVLGASMTTAVAALLVLFRRRWALLFTSDPAIVSRLTVLMLPLGLSLAGDGVSTVLAGVLRGSGRQTLGAVINGGVAWGLGLPLQAALAFRAGLGVAGMWWGAALATTMQAAVEVVCVARFDWSREAERAADLMRQTHREPLLLSEQEELVEEFRNAPLAPVA